jgi:hypothetical protein
LAQSQAPEGGKRKIINLFRKMEGKKKKKKKKKKENIFLSLP